jgi:hypothetical protein
VSGGSTRHEIKESIEASSPAFEVSERESRGGCPLPDVISSGSCRNCFSHLDPQSQRKPSETIRPDAGGTAAWISRTCESSEKSADVRCDKSISGFEVRRFSARKFHHAEGVGCFFKIAPDYQQTPATWRESHAIRGRIGRCRLIAIQPVGWGGGGGSSRRRPKGISAGSGT